MVSFKTFIFTLLLISFVSCQKDSDESRPYEFGFTIDGEQHRHEKKDVKGIIQGEFGFITADGIYHVTVYATDENGNFKIISRRNVRVSAPLDGSPLPPGQVISGSQPIKTNPAVQNQQIQPQTQSLQSQLQSSTTTRPRTTYAFTTLPTIKPACAGCGYITTIKPKPGEPFSFQNPAFQKPILPVSSARPIKTISSNNYNNQIVVTNSKFPNSQVNTFSPVYPNTADNSKAKNNYPNIVISKNIKNVANAKTLGIAKNLHGPNSVNTNISSASTNNDGPSNNNRNSFNFNTELIYKNSLGITYSNSPDQYPNNKQTNLNIISNRNAKKITYPELARSPLAQVSVTNGVIHVPGNPDIPIKDKFSGMVDGLPNGIEEKDITNLLYKFNYTIGFHGHYEKGLRDGTKIGGYFVNGRDGVSQVVTYIADANGFRPKVKFIRLDLNSDDVPKEATEKTFGLKNFEFIWYPIS